MKAIETIKKGEQYAAVTVGSINEIKDYELEMGPGVVIPGKVFCGQALGLTGAEISFQSFQPGQDSGFLHSHKTHEEVYIIIKGEGLYQVDGEVFPVSEGSLIRVSPKGKRALKNTGSGEMVMMCIQYKANSFGAADTPASDGNMLQDKLTW